MATSDEVKAQDSKQSSEDTDDSSTMGSNGVTTSQIMASVQTGANSASSIPSMNTTPASSNTPQAGSSSASKVTKTRTMSMPAIPYTGPYDLADYQFQPIPDWPPPVFIRPQATAQERYYLENRWYSQWQYFDKRAKDNKSRYMAVQLIIGIGSVVIPSLISIGAFNNTLQFRDLLDVTTVLISLGIAIAATLESLNQYGEFWRSYRQAAEELQAEKTYYDMHSGLYYKNPDPFAMFVQRCEEIMAKQNGRFIQSVERQQTEAEQQVDSILSEYRDDDETVTVSRTTTTSG